MIEVWDYFMRRKGVLLAIFAVFLVSSILSYNVFRSSATDHPTEYISIHRWGDDRIEIPNTGGEVQPIVLAVLRPEEVTNLAPRQDTEEITSLAPRLDTEVIAEYEPGVTPDPTDAQQGSEPLATTENPGVTPDPLAEQSEDSPSEEFSDNDPEVSDDGAEPSSNDPEPSEEPSADATDQDLASQDSGVISPAENTAQAQEQKQEQDSSSASSNPTEAPREDCGYLILLVAMGLIVAGFGTYFLEQHFWR